MTNQRWQVLHGATGLGHGWIAQPEEEGPATSTPTTGRTNPMTNNEKKMIDPADVRALLEACDSTDPRYSDFENLVSGLRNLLSRDCPEDMFGMWAEHPEYGRVLVCHSKPDNDGEVAIRFRDDGECTGVSQKWVAYTTLSFPEQHPETLTTVEDFKNAPEGTIVAREHERAWTKLQGAWRSQGGSFNDAGMKRKPLRVLRWGWIQ